MEITPGAHVFRFGVFELDGTSGELRRHGLKIRLPDQSFQVLKLLLARPGEVVTRDDLRKALWTSDTFVDFDAGLNSAVRKLREALDDSTDSPRFVETVPRRGYRFLAPVTAAVNGPTADDAVALVTTAPARRPLRRAAAVLSVVLVAAAAGVYQHNRLSEPLTANRDANTVTRQARVVLPQAQEAYEKGLTAQGQQRYPAFQRAVEYFEEALGIQPDFAEAHAALAFVQLQFLYDGPHAPHEVIPKAESAARRAIELDDTLARAHWVLGRILIVYHWRPEEGLKMLDRAAGLQKEALDPNGASTHRRRGQFPEAIAAAERARDLDPRSLAAQVAVGSAYRAAGQHDRALSELRRALEISPGRPRVHHQIGMTYLAMGRPDQAIRELEIAARPETGHIPRVEAHLGYAYAAAGRIAEARAVLEELADHRRAQYVSWFGTALVHDALGEKEGALVALRRAFEDRAVEFSMTDLTPPFKAVADDPRFLAMMREAGVSR